MVEKQVFRTKSKIYDVAFSRQQLMAFNRLILSWKTYIDVWLAYKSFLSRFSMLINYAMWSSNLFCCIQLFPSFFIVLDFQSPNFSWSRFFWVLVFLGPGFSRFRFFWVQVFQGSGPGTGSTAWIQVLEVAL